MRSKLLQKLVRYRAKLAISIFVVAILAYTAFSSVLNYDLDAIVDDSFSTPLNGAQPASQKGETPGQNAANVYDSHLALVNQKEKSRRVHSFWDKVFTIFDENDVLYKGAPQHLVEYVGDKIEGTYIKEALLARGKMSDRVVAELKSRHEKVVKKLPDEIPEYTYDKGTKGVVFIGGDKFSWLTYLAILALRETGSKLPVEVVMPQRNDYERERSFCDRILPSLGAKCLVVPDILGISAEKEKSFFAYQFKSLALVVSSFENILLLDSDNIIISNPDVVFESELYKQYGMITWPDYWKRTISPRYYEIANIAVNEQKRVRINRFPLFEPSKSQNALRIDIGDASVPYHDLENAVPDLSTESGQLFINKGTHGKVILLSLYYNIYGPQLFYRLFSLGEQGEGDKDTFAAAAVALNQPYYQVNSYIQSHGYFDDEAKFQGVAMAQKHPVLDFDKFQNLIVRPFENSGKSIPIDEQVEKLNALAKESDENFGSANDVPIFTVHCNFPKLDPVFYMSRNDLYDSVANKLKRRLYSRMKYKKTKMEGAVFRNEEVDFEYEQWLHLQEALCVKKLEFVYFKYEDMDQLCSFIANQVTWLALDSS
ncbi:uncharacterized protein LODBEIA_P05370 [Lodderomyces beijingensis]|uniref:Alpha-1,2-mannosyltransferase n=1 Tax=Lodderomyces beijingensis TaxID=1775926 RepID=A0ABP0ZDR7_9ASCO